MAKPFYKLRAKIMENGMLLSDFEKKINKSHAYVSFRICGKKPWTVTEMYEISALLGIPRKDILEHFPEQV